MFQPQKMPYLANITFKYFLSAGVDAMVKFSVLSGCAATFLLTIQLTNPMSPLYKLRH